MQNSWCSHLNNKDLLHPTQFGLRNNYSTETACCYFLEVSKTKLDEGEVFPDLHKAFDMSKFKLSAANNELSSINLCTMGVPLGSILGPLLFSLYFNDLPSVCEDVDIQMYDDDSRMHSCERC